MSIDFRIDGDRSVNLSNDNAAAMLRLMGLEPAPFGEIADGVIDSCIRRLTRVVNSRPSRRSEIAPGFQAGNYIFGGRTDDQIARNASRMLELCVAARREGRAVCWD